MCPVVMFTNNGADQNLGAGNQDVGPLNPDWFMALPSGLSLTLDGAAVFGGLAVWNTGDPLTDIDGDLRPDVAGTEDVAGADVP